MKRNGNRGTNMQKSPRLSLLEFLNFQIFNKVPKHWKLEKCGMYYDTYHDPRSNHDVVVEKKEGRILWR